MARALDRRGFTYVVISEQRAEVEALRARGIQALFGEASNIELLERADVEHARLVIVASSDPHVTPLIVERAKALNPAVDFVVRTAERRGDRAAPGDQPEGPGRPRAARAGGPDGALLAPSVRGELGRGRVDRPGPARSPGRRRSSRPGPPSARGGLGGRLRSIWQRLSRRAGRGTLTGRDPQAASSVTAPSPLNVPSRQATTIARAVIATTIVEMALISGETPNLIAL